MTTEVVTDEQYEKVSKRAHELLMRVAKGAIPVELAMDGLQLLIEGQKVQSISTKKDWLREILKLERKCHLDFFGEESDLSEFEKILKRYGWQKIRRWKKLGLEPHFLPKVTMFQDVRYPGWRIKLKNWYYESVIKGKILRNINGQLEVDKSAPQLKGIIVLVDTRLKPRYYNGKQMYEDDNLFGSVIQKLRKEEKIAKYEHGPQSSRFGISSDEWEEQIKPVLAQKIGLEPDQIRLERAIEANVIPQLYSYMPRKQDGNTNTWVWYEEYFGGRGRRLSGGNSGDGGLADVDFGWPGGHWDGGSFRPLAVL